MVSAVVEWFIAMLRSAGREMSMLSGRYVIALLAASTVVLGCALFCLHTRRAVLSQFRESVRDPANADSVSPELITAAEEGTLSNIDVGMEVSPSLIWRISASDWLVGFWPIWILLTYGVSFALAHYLGQPPEPP